MLSVLGLSGGTGEKCGAKWGKMVDKGGFRGQSGDLGTTGRQNPSLRIDRQFERQSSGRFRR